MSETKSETQDTKGTPKFKLEKPKVSIGIAAVAAVLLLGGAITAFWAIAQKRPLPEIPVGAELIPEDALMTLSLTTNAGQWQRMREFGTPESQKLLDNYLVQLRDRYLTANGFQYEKDIQPWVGSEVTLGFLPPFPVNAAGENKEEVVPSPAAFSGRQSLLMVLPIANPSRAKQILESAQPPQGGRWVPRTYKNIEIKETQGVPDENRFSVTVIDGRYLAIAKDSETINRAIDTFLGAPSIVDAPGAIAAWQKIETSRPFGRFYVNVPVAAAVASLNSDRADPNEIAQQQQNQGFATSITLQTEGIAFDTVAWLKPDSERKYAVENNGKTMTTRLPADTLMMMSGGNLQRVWQDYSQGVATNPLAPISPDWLKTAIRNTTTLDLEKDLLPWMQGEFSLAMLPPAENNTSFFPVGVVLMVQASDRRAGEAILAKLDKVMTEQYNFKVEQAQIGEQPLVKWTAQNGSVSVNHGWLDGNVAFISVLAPVAERIIPKPQTPLAMSQQFQSVVPLELSPNNGHFFMDMERTLNQNTPAWLQLPPQQQIAISAMRAIGVTAAIENQRTTRYQVFVAMKKAGSAQPLPGATLPGAQPSTPSLAPKAPATPEVQTPSTPE
ncbi:DUF3352 domain-containing protein [Laspinema olomoucense]|uniref:DUF3352 domain-containing protein n=1 Tax=Laspinema olomoucense D3b TaxID=2953688 RepID=A0ABT2N9N6_9CYAN|nr:DUF3352 domain-containing protein [Laspinema sp. D3b]MCT7979292.1 DUF3352 domain-containing protein [Laspinema sp. D3b]